MSNEVIKYDTAIELEWTAISGANVYWLQVSLTPDFSDLVYDENAVASTPHAFTDDEENDRKRYWRWSYSTDAGVTWSEWSEVSSYWLNTSASANVSLTSNRFTLINPNSVTDRFLIETLPVFSIQNQFIDKFPIRNRLGELLSEYVDIKSEIRMAFADTRLIRAESVRAIHRFNQTVKTFFVALKFNNGQDDIVNIWLVEMIESPLFTPVAMSRGDLFEGEILFTEV